MITNTFSDCAAHIVCHVRYGMAGNQFRLAKRNFNRGSVCIACLNVYGAHKMYNNNDIVISRCILKFYMMLFKIKLIYRISIENSRSSNTSV